MSPLCACILSLFSCVQLFVTLWTVTRLLCPWRFSRQEYWSGLPCLLPGDLPNSWIKPSLLHWQTGSLPLVPPGKPPCLPSVQFSSVAQKCPTFCDPMVCGTTGLPVHHQLLEFTQTHVHWVSDAILPSHPLSSPSPPAFNLSQQQGLFKWVSSLHQVAKVLEFQLQHQSFQWALRTDLL